MEDGPLILADCHHLPRPRIQLRRPGFLHTAHAHLGAVFYRLAHAGDPVAD